MRTSIFLFAVLLIAAGSNAQDKKIEADRPGETQTPNTVSKGYFQAEIGFEKEQQTKDDYTLLHPQMHLKYGLSKRFEIRAEITAESDKQSSSNEFTYGLNPIEIGFKAQLLEAKGVLPQTSLYTQVGIPKLASKDHQTPHAIPHLRLLFENKLTEKLHLDYNIGADWDGEQTAPQWLYTIAPELEIGEKWEVFVEEFAYFQKGQASLHHFDGGIAYFPIPNVKLDVYGGKGISKEAPDYFISAGISFRLK